MEIVKIDQIPVTRSPRGPKVRKVLSHQSVAINEVILEPNEELPPHTTPVDVFFYVRSGSGKVSIGNEEQEVVAGDVIFSPKDIPHGLKSTEGTFSVLVVKTPNPAYGE